MFKLKINVFILFFLTSVFANADEVLKLKEGVRRATSPPPMLFISEKNLIRVIPSMSFVEIWDYNTLMEKEKKFMGKKIRTALLREKIFLILYYDNTADIYKFPSWKKLKTIKNIKPKVIKSLMNSCNSCLDLFEGKIFFVTNNGIVIDDGKKRKLIKGEFNGLVVDKGKIFAGRNNFLEIFDISTLKKIDRVKLKGEILFINKFGKFIVADTTEGVYLINNKNVKELVKKDFGFIGRAFKYIRFPVHIKGNLIMYPEIVNFGKFVLGTEYYIRIYDLKNKKFLCSHKVLMNDSAGFISDGIIYDIGSIIYTRIDAEFLKVNCGGKK